MDALSVLKREKDDQEGIDKVAHAACGADRFTEYQLIKRLRSQHPIDALSVLKREKDDQEGIDKVAHAACGADRFIEHLAGRSGLKPVLVRSIHVLGATVPLMLGHRIMGPTLAFTGDFAGALAHYVQSLALYNPAEHRLLATRFGTDAQVTSLFYRALDLWLLGYPEAALADADHAIKEARKIGQAATLMVALALTSITHIFCGNYATANALLDELAPLADEKSASFWEAFGMLVQGGLFALTGKAADAVPNAHLRDHSMAVNGSNIFYAVVLIMFGGSLCGTRSIQ
jgi:hypothetical protein